MVIHSAAGAARFDEPPVLPRPTVEVDVRAHCRPLADARGCNRLGGAQRRDERLALAAFAPCLPNAERTDFGR
jgi:hypothetical protein